MWMQMERAEFEAIARLAEESGRMHHVSQQIRKRLALEDSQASFRSAFLQTARRLHHREGGLEFDDDATVSIGADPGAYVMGWQWVEVSEIQIGAKAAAVI